MKNFLLLSLVTMFLSVTSISTTSNENPISYNNEKSFAQRIPDIPDIIAPNPGGYDNYYGYYTNGRRYLGTADEINSVLKYNYPAGSNGPQYRQYATILGDVNNYPMFHVSIGLNQDATSLFTAALLYQASFDPTLLYGCHTYVSYSVYEDVSKRDVFYWTTGLMSFDPFGTVGSGLLKDEYKLLAGNGTRKDDVYENIHDAAVMFAYFMDSYVVWGYENPFSTAFIQTMDWISNKDYNMDDVLIDSGILFAHAQANIDILNPLVVYDPTFHALIQPDGDTSFGGAYVYVVGYARKILRKDNELYYSYELICDFGNREYAAVEVNQFVAAAVMPMIDINNL